MQFPNHLKSVRALNHNIQFKIMNEGPFLHILMKEFKKEMQPQLLPELIRAQQILYNLVKMKAVPTSTAYNKLKSGTAPFFQ